MSNGELSIVDRVHSWLDFNGFTDVTADHFYLKGDSLDDFIKDIIRNAKKSVKVVNPFVDKCAISDSLMGATKKTNRVVLLTRSIDKNDHYYDSKVAYHETLKKSYVVVAHNDRIHAKLIVVDELVAVVSSLNFYSASSSGKTWEAGMVSLNPEVIKQTSESITELLGSTETSIEKPIIVIQIDKTVQNTPENVFRYITEPECIPVWNSYVERAELTTKSPLQAGSTGKYYLKGNKSVKGTYLEYIKNKKMMTMSRQNNLLAIENWELTSNDKETNIGFTQVMIFPNKMNGKQYLLVEKSYETALNKIIDQLVEIL